LHIGWCFSLSSFAAQTHFPSDVKQSGRKPCVLISQLRAPMHTISRLQRSQSARCCRHPAQQTGLTFACAQNIQPLGPPILPPLGIQRRPLPPFHRLCSPFPDYLSISDSDMRCIGNRTCIPCRYQDARPTEISLQVPPCRRSGYCNVVIRIEHLFTYPSANSYKFIHTPCSQLPLQRLGCEPTAVNGRENSD